MRSYRYYILLICVAGITCPWIQAQSQSLTVERLGNYLRVAAPQMHFLEGKPLAQLHDGASVTYSFALTLTAGGASTIHLQERFILSYDLWEEKFSVVQAGAPAHSASHLTAAAAEAWCLDNLAVPVPAFGPGKTFAIKLECRIAENGAESGGESRPLTLAGLIDVFSRKGQEAPLRWEAVSGPLHLSDLKDKKQRAQKTWSQITRIIQNRIALCGPWNLWELWFGL